MIEGKQRYTVNLWIIKFKCILNVICTLSFGYKSKQGQSNIISEIYVMESGRYL